MAGSNTCLFRGVRAKNQIVLYLTEPSQAILESTQDDEQSTVSFFSGE